MTTNSKLEKNAERNSELRLINTVMEREAVQSNGASPKSLTSRISLLMFCGAIAALSLTSCDPSIVWIDEADTAVAVNTETTLEEDVLNIPDSTISSDTYYSAEFPGIYFVWDNDTICFLKVSESIFNAYESFVITTKESNTYRNFKITLQGEQQKIADNSYVFLIPKSNNNTSIDKVFLSEFVAKPVPEIVIPIANLEIPETKPDEEIVSHTAYSLVYNEDHEQANWVGYMLCKERTKKVVNRNDNFRADPAIKTGSATAADYKNSKYDRGHLAPCGDMTWSFVTMDESFFFSNMSPQVPKFNQGIWEKLESLVRKWAAAYDTLYIVTGPVLEEGLPSIGANKVSIPKYYYKVVLNYTSNDIKGIGFIMPNEESSKPLQDYAITIDSVQKFTGINFYNKIPNKKYEKEIETSLCVDCWIWK